MNELDVLNKIAVSMIPGAGSILSRKLIGITGSPEALFAESKKNLLKIPGIPRNVIDRVMERQFMARAERELDFITQHNILISFYQDATFPQRLNECYDGPVLLYHKGHIDFNKDKVLSIVGTRRNTRYGEKMTEQIVDGLAEAGVDVNIVSGLAYGIDILAHKAALKNQLGTMAVLAHGLDDVYPKKHTSSAEAMFADGGLVSEFPQSTIPEAANFVRRNRIVAGMSDATIVIESGYKGGAMITANLAFSYDREVFAVPGESTKYYSQGCNWLIKTQKANMVENAEDVIKVMNWDLPSAHTPIQKKLFLDLSPDEERIMEMLYSKDQATMNELSIQLSMQASQLSMCLLNLEMQGAIRSLPGNVFAKA